MIHRKILDNYKDKNQFQQLYICSNIEIIVLYVVVVVVATVIVVVVVDIDSILSINNKTIHNIVVVMDKQ